MSFDLGDDKRYTKRAKALQLGEMIILPICLGCEHQIEEGTEYVTNSSGSLSFHANGFCKDLAEKNHSEYWKVMSDVF